jgi:hypothetical protein
MPSPFGSDGYKLMFISAKCKLEIISFRGLRPASKPSQVFML